ncbi:peptidoglycan-binding protein [Peribacillus frigoritolerans]
MYGKGTAAVVKAYQKRKKLSADGIVGVKTWAVMF